MFLHISLHIHEKRQNILIKLVFYHNSTNSDGINQIIVGVDTQTKPLLVMLHGLPSRCLGLQEPYADYRRHGGAATPIHYVPGGVPTTNAMPQVGHTHSPTAGSVIWTDISHSTQRYGSVFLYSSIRVLIELTHL